MVQGMVYIAQNDGPRRTEDLSRKGTENSFSKAKPKVTFWVKQIIEMQNGLETPQKQRTNERTNE